MKMQLLLCIITFLLLFTSCSKQTESPISDATAFGHVFDKFTQEPILGAEVHLYQSEFTSFVSPDRITYLETTLTDKDGFFEFQFEELDFPFSHFVYVEEHGFFPEQKDAEKNMEILLEPQVELRVKLKNITPYDNNDKIAISVACGYETFIGQNIDTLISCFARPERRSALTYWVTKNNIKTEFKDSIFTAIPSIQYDINY